MKNIKVKASTHSRLTVLASMLNLTVGEVIDELMEKTYPAIVKEVDSATRKVRTLKADIEHQDT
jgi:hypothetical protein